MDKVNKSKIFHKERIIDVARSFIIDVFGMSRIECVILYGSSITDDSLPPEDYDLLLLLDTYNTDDVAVLRKLKDKIPVELFIDYKDHILRKGFNNYQRGRHGSYFFACLAYGECIIGDNFYKHYLSHIDRLCIKKDLLFRIEEYFYRIQKHYLNATNVRAYDQIRKYILRIVFDILLYSEVIELRDFHKVHYLNIYEMYVSKSLIFNDQLKQLLGNFLRKEDMTLVPLIIKELYELYLFYFERYNSEYAQK